MTAQIDHRLPSYWALGVPLSRFGRSVWAITLREYRVRYGKRRLGVFWAFAEPLAYVVGFTFIMSFSRAASPLGGGIAPFIATGLMTYMLVNSTESSVRSAIRPNAALLSFPRVRPIDLFLGRWLIEVTTLLLVTVVLFTAFWLAGAVEPPDEPWRLLLPLGLAMMAGFGGGIVNASIITVFKPWTAIYPVISKVNFLTSGIFFTVAAFPPTVTHYLWWQPVLHLTEWVRSAYYGSYESTFYDVWYPATVAVGLFFTGLVLERVNRVRLMNTKN